MPSQIDYYLELVKKEPSFIEKEAKRIRKKHYGNQVTFSKNIFLPIVKLCRDNCAYCGFSRELNPPWISPTYAKKLLKQAKELGCKESLIVSGDRPETRFKRVRTMYKQFGISSIVEYAILFLKESLDEELLPHVNIGVLKEEEWVKLKPFIASAGLMLESTSKKLLLKGGAHYASPDKIPKIRIKSIIHALRNKIPFTTGILVGIGETLRDRIETLLVIKKLYEMYPFIQEIIIQPFHPLPNTPMRNWPVPDRTEILDVINLARIVLPPNISIQIPPNLLDSQLVLDGLKTGANDLGGISPITIDYVNTTSPWPKIDYLRDLLNKNNLLLKERLPVYSLFYHHVGDQAKPVLKKMLKNVTNE